MHIEEYLSSLNEKQLAAASFPNQNMLILAGAGTGKTRTIIARAAYLISQGVDPTRIQILAFTRKAAFEIKSRVQAILPEQSHGLSCSTFHSWCAKLQRAAPSVFGFEDYTNIDRDDQLQLFRMARGEFKDIPEDMPKAARILEIYSYARNTLVKLSDAIVAKEGDLNHQEFFATVMTAYQEKKRARNYLDYDDILDLVAKTLNQSAEAADWVGGLYDSLMIDEMQDTNPLQWKIISPLKDRLKLSCVGDDAQSIYGFRGADFKNIHSFCDRVPDAKVLKLEENYRSTQEILNVANWLIDGSPLNYDKRLVANRQSGELPRLISFDTAFQEGEWTAQQILTHYKDGGEFRDHMILVRSMFSGRAVEAALLRHKIPYVFYGGFKLLEAAHIKDVLSCLRIAANPDDEIAWIRYLKLWKGIGDRKAVQIFNSSRGAESWDERLAALSNSEIPTGAYQTLERVVQSRTDVEAALRTCFAGLKSTLESKYSNQNWDRREGDFPILYELAKGHSSILEFIEEYILSPAYHAIGSDATQKDLVIISTIHSAKGLESKIVFVNNVSPGSFPSGHATTEDEVEEERRVLYVALTRARDTLICTRSMVLWHKDNADRTGQSYFLNDIPAHLFSIEAIADKKASLQRPPKIDQANDVTLGIEFD